MVQILGKRNYDYKIMKELAELYHFISNGNYMQSSFYSEELHYNVISNVQCVSIEPQSIKIEIAIEVTPEIKLVDMNYVYTFTFGTNVGISKSIFLNKSRSTPDEHGVRTDLSMHRLVLKNTDPEHSLIKDAFIYPLIDGVIEYLDIKEEWTYE